MKRRSLLPLAIALAFAVAKVSLGAHLAHNSDLEPYDVAFVPRAAAVRLLAPGHPTLVANLYWLRAVQYMGDPRANQRGWDKLYPLLDLVTELDPRHGYAYQVGANILASAGRVAESNRLLEKGVVNLPERYILPFHRAVNAFMYAGDYAEAGRWFERSALSPGAPRHMREAVMAVYVKGDQADAAIRFLEHMLAETAPGDAEGRKALEAQLLQARLEKVAIPLDEAAAAFQQARGRFPRDAEELRAAGLVANVPPDPAGGTWRFDEEGRAHSTVHDRRVMRPLSPAEREKSLARLRDNIRSTPIP